ncbi:bifunctional diaminohydroxyphosphoribosylaminopyrimidine deaminase/5-amino-6-(5-phosphoribosylamino)uracil reductase RibD [Geothermobacter hydrogeniphilus]|uniref:Riboflavin biosynthesis protein RibD n=1 Tax=Geothermobacter hydrogeniphilus TaxID=1969733 RepID=A0A2K2H8J9_9BACT|nr:bifunctional diaminohydroxyphosphoribosylaminopyrimidine deaminase/5-amino-6-(5-phosphoribosylamino)uracil reductase RibD [Geothermobacter hydrogeniphilus]PNU19550.1 bifunctional diaminohydroxyphosphoribosylaminopyrimidine deaminase/5-amino-6-(5-phosphoribosylamino)uracil reductase RibD [Geothermobacter hydrogeniphilus]
MNTPEDYMRRALALAKKGEGRTRPNPPVGAVIVKDGRIVGEGFHPAAGRPHAEIFALRQAGEEARGADVYVTLEPCSHTGRTGPCAEALICSGVKKVWIGAGDPNPRVDGRGVALLRAAGVEVESGLLGDDCRWLIAPFSMHMSIGRPLVTLKAAVTLDGKTATCQGESQWISGEQSRADVHRLRDRVDAIMVGVGTVLRDNPRLTTRLPGGDGHDPLRVVVDSRLRTPVEAAVINRSSDSGVVIATTPQADSDRVRALENAGARVLVCNEIEGQGVDLQDLLRHLGKMDIMHLLLEGGAILNQGAFNADIIDRVRLYVAPMLFGGSDGKDIFSGHGIGQLAAARKLGPLKVSGMGDDLLVEGEVLRCSPA